MAHSARYIMRAFHPTLRAAPGAYVGLGMVSHSMRCRFATELVAGQRPPLSDHTVFGQNIYGQHNKSLVFSFVKYTHIKQDFHANAKPKAVFHALTLAASSAARLPFANLFE